LINIDKFRGSKPCKPQRAFVKKRHISYMLTHNSPACLQMCFVHTENIRKLTAGGWC